MTCLLYVFFWLCHCTLVYKRSTFCNQFKLMNDTVKKFKKSKKSTDRPKISNFPLEGNITTTKNLALWTVLSIPNAIPFCVHVLAQRNWPKIETKKSLPKHPRKYITSMKRCTPNHANHANGLIKGSWPYFGPDLIHFILFSIWAGIIRTV